MLKCCRRSFALVDPKTIDRYLAHLVPSGRKGDVREVIPLMDLLPNPADPADEIVAFHSQLTARLSSPPATNRFCGVQVMHASSEAVKLLRGSESLHWPVFNDDFIESSSQPVSIQRKTQPKIQHIECGLCFEINGCNAVKFSPLLILSGTRYTYFAPHVQGLAADRGGLVRCVRGPWVQFHPELPTTSHVLLRDGEPLRVGSCKAQLTPDFASLLLGAIKYAARIADNAPVQYVLVGGTHSRAVATHGKYSANFGPFGEVSCVLE